jgi:uncharacterized membrane protein YphA (DoxX/SURF4 family)
MDSNRLLMRFASLPLRSNVGFGFIMHGYLKIERGMDVFAAALQGLGIKFLAATAQGPQFGKPGIECDLLYLACLATLVAGGSGPFSIDRWRARARDSIGAGHTRTKSRAPQ